MRSHSTSRSHRTGEIEPVARIVSDNGGPFRSFTFEALVAAHPELRHVRLHEAIAACLMVWDTQPMQQCPHRR